MTLFCSLLSSKMNPTAVGRLRRFPYAQIPKDLEIATLRFLKVASLAITFFLIDVTAKRGSRGSREAL